MGLQQQKQIVNERRARERLALIETPFIPDNIRFTEDGGVAVLLTAGETINRGMGVYSQQGGGTDLRVYKTPANADMCFGVAYNDADAGESIWVVTTGIAYVLPTSSVTAARGYVIYSSGTEAGRCDQAATVPSIATHVREWGHFIETGAGAGELARAMIHYL